MERRTPEAEREALEGLIRSDGWSLYRAAMEDRWNHEAYEREIRAVTHDVRAGEDVTGLIQQINATYEGMRKMLKWPEERLRQIRDGAEGRKAAMVTDVFARFRRTPGRTA